MSVHPTVRPPAPTHTMGSEAFWSSIWFFAHRLFHQRLCHVVKFSTFQWLSFEWRFLKIDIRLQKDFGTVVIKVCPRVWCKARREAKHRLFCSAPTQLCNYPDSSFLYMYLLMLKRDKIMKQNQNHSSLNKLFLNSIGQYLKWTYISRQSLVCKWATWTFPDFFHNFHRG